VGRLEPVKRVRLPAGADHFKNDPRPITTTPVKFGHASDVNRDSSRLPDPVKLLRRNAIKESPTARSPLALGLHSFPGVTDKDTSPFLTVKYPHWQCEFERNQAGQSCRVWRGGGCIEITGRRRVGSS
jgi:hypothetical protein